MDSLGELESIVQKCNKCPLSKTRTKVVFGAGNKENIIMFIGEGPGYHEDQLGQPFVGKAGVLFDKMLAAIGLTRNDVYITNIVKCRPPNNRNPLETECEKCLEYLRWQVRIVDPEIIICLGAVAARNIIQRDFKITSKRGIWYKRGKFNIMATYHPAAILRDNNKKRDAWEDFKSIKNMYTKLSQGLTK